MQVHSFPRFGSWSVKPVFEQPVLFCFRKCPCHFPTWTLAWAAYLLSMNLLVKESHHNSILVIAVLFAKKTTITIP